VVQLSQSWAYQAWQLNSTVGILSGFSLIGYIKQSYYPVEIHGLVAMMWLTIWIALSSMKRIQFAFTPVVYSNVDYAF